MPASYRFTVLTPTYNRAHTLPGVFASLCSQTFRDFEWLVVDDGSTDGSRELVLSWKSFFPIRYVWKPNGGKHTAVNLGVELAQGEFTLVFDSDDRCVPHALERFDFHWKQLPNPERFVGLSCLCCDENGNMVGQPLPGDYVDTFSLRDVVALAKAERWGVLRTDIWRNFPYPVFQGERFVPEGLTQKRMFARYSVRCFNEVLRIYVNTPASLSRSDPRRTSPRGAVLYYKELALAPRVSLWTRLRSLINLVRFLPRAVYRTIATRRSA